MRNLLPAIVVCLFGACTDTAAPPPPCYELGCPVTFCTSQHVCHCMGEECRVEAVDAGAEQAASDEVDGSDTTELAQPTEDGVAPDDAGSGIAIGHDAGAF